MAFGDGALVVAQPTSDREPVTDALARLTPSGGTSTGAGLYTALEAIAGEPLAIVDETADDEATGNATRRPDTTVESGQEDDLEFDPANVDVGYFGAAEVVMFSDGENTSGIDPIQVSDLLAAAGVKVTTIAVGTEAGAVIEVEGYSVSTALDSEQLEQIAAATNGTFYAAADTEHIGAIADALELEWRTRGRADRDHRHPCRDRGRAADPGRRPRRVVAGAGDLSVVHLAGAPPRAPRRSRARRPARVADASAAAQTRWS